MKIRIHGEYPVLSENFMLRSPFNCYADFDQCCRVRNGGEKEYSGISGQQNINCLELLGLVFISIALLLHLNNQ